MTNEKPDVYYIENKNPTPEDVVKSASADKSWVDNFEFALRSAVTKEDFVMICGLYGNRLLQAARERDELRAEILHIAEYINACDMRMCATMGDKLVQDIIGYIDYITRQLDKYYLIDTKSLGIEPPLFELDETAEDFIVRVNSAIVAMCKNLAYFTPEFIKLAQKLCNTNE